MRLQVTSGPALEPADREEEIVSCVVVWTELQSTSLVQEIKYQDGEIGKLIHSGRQRNGHVVLMARGRESMKLREQVQGLKELGLKAKPYHFYQEPLSSRANSGLTKQVREAGMCEYFFRSEPCPRGGNCTLRCHAPPDRHY